MANNGVAILTDAIARNSALVLSLPSAGMLRHHKSRFLAEDEGGFWIESMAGDASLVDELINTQTSVGISFRAGPQKVSFAVPILKREAEFRVNSEIVVPALQLTFPADVKAVQRRSNYRVRVPQDGELFIRLWRVSEQAVITDKPMATQELMAKVRDISIGGLGVMLLPKAEEPPRVLSGERLRLSLRYREYEELVLEGRMRYMPPAGSPTPIRCGIQFKKLENNLEGRQALAALTRIVGELQREEVRRTRLGIKVA